MIILHLPNASGSGASFVIRPHFLLSQLLKQRVPKAAEWVFVCVLAVAGGMGACMAAAAHAKGNGDYGGDDDDGYDNDAYYHVAA